MGNKKTHWETVYETKPADSVSWFQPHAEKSLEIIQATGQNKHAALIDVGGGASTLVDDLLNLGYDNLSVLDLSAAALNVAQDRLGAKAATVNWLVGDITNVPLPANAFDIWHDRAVFHFLTEEADRRAYVAQVMRSVRPNGHIIIATFAEDGPEKCSGLPVMRYSPEALHQEFGRGFQLVSQDKETHHTPFGTDQQFIYCYCRKP
jgi:ubiquinone/menaquinone biosynthesis C-methylase UbiE